MAEGSTATATATTGPGFVSEVMSFVSAICYHFYGLKRMSKVTVIVGFFTVRAITNYIFPVPQKIRPRRLLADDPKKAVYKPKTIYLHILPRGLVNNIPNLTPFVLKVETWLRLHGIEYEVREAKIQES